MSVSELILKRKNFHLALLFIFVSVLFFLPAFSQQMPPLVEKKDDKAPKAPIEIVMIHPLYATFYTCSEHYEGNLPYIGDDLGSDCLIMGGGGEDESGFLSTFRNDGLMNEDWYGWGQSVLAPFDGVVDRITINSVTNKPGTLGKGPATFVIFKREDGTRVLIAHLADISVKQGDSVRAGQPFAKVGNNGFSRSPHIHVGAWKDKTPLQIRFDLRAAAELQRKTSKTP